MRTITGFRKPVLIIATLTAIGASVSGAVAVAATPNGTQSGHQETTAVAVVAVPGARPQHVVPGVATPIPGVKVTIVGGSGVTTAK